MEALLLVLAPSQDIPVDFIGMALSGVTMWPQVMLSRYNEIDSTHFLDPNGNTVIEVDHVKQVALSSKEAAAEREAAVGPRYEKIGSLPHTGDRGG